MDEKSILLMSEELRAALGEKTRAAVENDEVLPGRWSRRGSPGSPGSPGEAGVKEIHLAARIVKCVAIKGGKTRLTLDVLDETPTSAFVSLIDSGSRLLLTAGSGSLHVNLAGRVLSARVDGGSPARVSILIDPAA